MPEFDQAIVPPIDDGKLKRATARITARKAPSPDVVLAKVLKLAVSACPDLLLLFYNTCLLQDIFCEAWKEQRLVVISKEGNPGGEPLSYRPLGLLLPENYWRHCYTCGCMTYLTVWFRPDLLSTRCCMLRDWQNQRALVIDGEVVLGC